MTLNNEVYFTEEEKFYICNSYINGKSLKKIGKELKKHPETIKKSLIKQNIKLRNNSFLSEKKCSNCKLIKPIIDFKYIKKYLCWCIPCFKIKTKKYQKENYLKHRDKRLEKSKEYIKNHKEEINIRKNNYSKQPHYRIHRSISSAINHHLKKFKSSKQGKSVFNILPYDKITFIKNIESKFESWMNWSNYGSYIPKLWKDNDQSTWTWQLDHIIPQSDLMYVSIQDDNFKKCWALDNLRPLNSKQNIIEGVTRIRHVIK